MSHCVTQELSGGQLVSKPQQQLITWVVLRITQVNTKCLGMEWSTWHMGWSAQDIHMGWSAQTWHGLPGTWTWDGVHKAWTWDGAPGTWTCVRVHRTQKEFSGTQPLFVIQPYGNTHPMCRQ